MVCEISLLLRNCSAISQVISEQFLTAARKAKRKGRERRFIAMEKYVIFDIDGTLSQTALYAAAACQKALDKGGKQVPEQEIISCIGEGLI